ncbi:MAG TPA: hypothetical protein VNY52_10865 [Solirubrobacteraceae bacterium]|nr:hypothetical protein [Solirubrobacteraceae bacterium]
MKAVNLIPPEQRSGGSVGARSEGAVFAVLGLLAGLAVLTLLYGVAHHQLSSRRAEAATLSARAQQVQEQAAALAPYTSFVALREQRLQAIAQLIGSRFDWAGSLGELSRVLPSDVALSTLAGTVGSTTAGTSSSSSSFSSSARAAATSSSASSAAAAATPISSATPPGAAPSFTLSGCAASQAVVAQTLVRLRLISGVSDVTLQSSTESGSGGGGGGSGSCPGGDPVFTVQASFQPLPTPLATSTEKLESTVATSAGQGAYSAVASTTAGGGR